MIPTALPLDFGGFRLRVEPFPHAVAADCLDAAAADRLLDWFETSAPWRLVETEFYEQYEFDLHDCANDEARLLTDDSVLSTLRQAMRELFDRSFEPQVSVVAHMLVPGQHIGIHNDFMEAGETHRLTVQLNRGLQDPDGGFFMTFSSSDPRDVHGVHRPLHRSAATFAISPASHHAVSRVHGSIRYTVVFSFHALAL